MRINVFVGVLCGLSVLLGCHHLDKEAEITSALQQNVQVGSRFPLVMHDLSREYAETRSRVISNLVYDVDVDLTSAPLAKATEFPGSEFHRPEFHGVVTISFDLSDVAKDLRLDFFKGSVQSFSINGHGVSIVEFKSQEMPTEKSSVTDGFSLVNKTDYQLFLNSSYLRKGANQVRVVYTHPYARDGKGLHRFVDPEDQKVYLYSQFETFDANRFMPCFDQPDLKAKFRLRVLAPHGWQVVSAAKAEAKSVQREIKEVGTSAGDVETWQFAETDPLSPYVFSLHAGPYEVFENRYVRKDLSELPLRILVRSSQKKFALSQDMFLFTQQGLEFFESYFARRYPFSKLDQLIVPEFNAGGMENAGAITYSEWTLERGTPTRNSRRGVAMVVLHELAHMWFGDLVTMKWWNDIWLNESFATFMSTLALAEATEFKEVWQNFASQTKAYAYQQDMKVTTHPIESEIRSVREAEVSFDGITYNKGAAVLQQLRFYIGDEAFKKGSQIYFQDFAFQNATLNDFLASLQKSQRETQAVAQTETKAKIQTKTQHNLQANLNDWAEGWLTQSGVDRLATSWVCEGDRLKEIKFELRETGVKKFRPLAVTAGLFRRINSKVQKFAEFRVEFPDEVAGEKSGADQVYSKIVRGDWQCPDMIYPNDGDQGYVRVALDTKSVLFIENNLSSIDDPFLRSLLWSDLWRMVRDFELPLKSYARIVKAHLAGEKDLTLLSSIAGTVARGWSSVAFYWPRSNVNVRRERNQFLNEILEIYLKGLRSSVSGSDLEKLYFGNYLLLVEARGDFQGESKKYLDPLVQWFQKGQVSDKFKLDLDRSWKIVWALSSLGDHRAGPMLAEMSVRDPSDQGRKNVLGVQAAQPGFANKQKMLNEYFHSSGQRSFQEVIEVAESLFPSLQMEERLRFKSDFWTYLDRNKKSDQRDLVSIWSRALLPLNCQSKNADQLQSFVGGFDGYDPGLKKLIMGALEEDRRCQRIRRTMQ